MAVARRRSYILRAVCDAADAVGGLVYISGPPVGGLYSVTTADPTDPSMMPVVATIVQKITPTLCDIQLYSVVRNVFSGLTPGAVYLVGTDGRPSTYGDPNYPTAGGVTQFQQIGVAVSATELLLFPLDSEFGSVSGGRYFQQPLYPTLNPIIFSTATPFKHGGVDTETVYYNGQRLVEGAGNDYTVSESGGPGTGYDTIVLAFVPRPNSNWRVDFCPTY